MKIQRFVAQDVRLALQQVRDVFGEDALIMANRQVEAGVEIVAACGYDDDDLEQLKAVTLKSPSLAPMTDSASVGSAAKQPISGIDSHASTMSTAFTGSQSIKDTTVDAPGAPQFATSYVSDEALKTMQAEINSLKGLLQSQLGQLVWDENKRRSPQQVTLINRLSALGLTPSVAREVSLSVPEQATDEQAWQLSLAQVNKRLPEAKQQLLKSSGVFAVVGATGVGKTTTIAKLAAQYALLHGNDKVALITTDSYRIGAHEQLGTFAKILKIPLKKVETPEQMRDALNSLKHKKLVLIDTAGLSQQDERVKQQQALLKAGGSQLTVLLALPATSQAAVLEAQINGFSELQQLGCVITKIDECLNLGAVLTTLMDSNVPMMYFTNGQCVPEDLHGFEQHSLVDLAVTLSARAPAQVDEEAIASLTLEGMH